MASFLREVRARFQTLQRARQRPADAPPPSRVEIKIRFRPHWRPMTFTLPLADCPRELARLRDAGEGEADLALAGHEFLGAVRAGPLSGKWLDPRSFFAVLTTEGQAALARAVRSQLAEAVASLHKAAR